MEIIVSCSRISVQESRGWAYCSALSCGRVQVGAVLVLYMSERSQGLLSQRAILGL